MNKKEIQEIQKILDSSADVKSNCYIYVYPGRSRNYNDIVTVELKSVGELKKFIEKQGGERFLKIYVRKINFEAHLHKSNPFML